MINILIPACGGADFFKESYYPKNLYEVNGKPMIEQVIGNYESIREKRFIYILLQEECNKFHTDNIISLLTEDVDIIRLKALTGGALCSCLMAVEYIDNETELIISNNDQIIDVDFEQVLAQFRDKETDCGVICFDAIHPRWSYVRCIEEHVVEAAEKRPISHNAIAGFYYFKRGLDFIAAAKAAIKKGSTHDDKYYITSAINEMILMNKTVRIYSIADGTYHSLYSPEKIRQYEKGES